MKFIVITKLMYKLKDIKNIVINFIFIVKTDLKDKLANANFKLFLKEPKNYIDNLIKINQI